MSTNHDIARANALLPTVSAILEQLRARRLELIALRDRFVVVQRRAGSGGGPGEASPDPLDPDSPRMLEARIRAAVDQMEAGVAQLVEMGIQLREIERGLIDFPAFIGGREIWLCWELGEAEEIHFWHERNAGYASRRPLIELT